MPPVDSACWLVGGFILLAGGAELLVRGATALARAAGVSPFVVGFLVIGFGTSVPELVVVISAAVANKPGVAVGGVIGSNVANIGLILGAAAVARPLVAKADVLKREVPLVIGASFLLLFLCRDNVLSRADAGVLLAAFAGVLVYILRTARRDPPPVAAGPKGRPWLAAGMLVAGLGLLVVGADGVVRGAVEVARGAGLSDIVIGMTVVAVGTSLPEFAAAVAAARRGQGDLALGNVLGSNLFNILALLGTAGMIGPLRLPDKVVLYDLPAVCFFAGLLVPVLLNGMRVHRWEGGVMLAAYAGFVGWQIMRPA